MSNRFFQIFTMNDYCDTVTSSTMSKIPRVSPLGRDFMTALFSESAANGTYLTYYTRLEQPRISLNLEILQLYCSLCVGHIICEQYETNKLSCSSS